MRRRVAITGMGVVAPNGNDIASFGDALLAGASGVGPVTLFDASSLPVRIAAEVKGMPRALRDRKISFAEEAARQAYGEATANGTRPRGVGGISLGIGLELFSLDDMASLRRSGGDLPSALADRLTLLQTPSDLCVHLLSSRYALEAPPYVHVSACAAGADAVGCGFRLVASGRRDWVLAGGADSMINPLGLAGFCRIHALSTRNDEPARASRPFDRDRNGFVLGEGAGMLLLEPLDRARERGATVHGEVVGYGNSFDAHGISEPHPDGRGAVQAMVRALRDARIPADRIDAVNAHGTSTRKNDPVESAALAAVLGNRARDVPVSATKSMIGHLVSAAGAVEAIAAVLCMERGRVHPTLNLENPDPLCDLDHVTGRARPHAQRYVLSNSFGFGGQNACLVLKAPEPGRLE